MYLLFSILQKPRNANRYHVSEQVKLAKHFYMILAKHFTLLFFNLKGRKMKKTSMLVLLTSGILAAGCAYNNTPNQRLQDGRDLIQQKASQAADAQRLYYETVNEEAVAMQRRQNAVASDLVDVDFIGTPQEFLKNQFAPRYGYSYHEEGNYRDLPYINVRVVKNNAMDVIRNVGHLTGPYADVIMNTDEKTITLRYR